MDGISSKGSSGGATLRKGMSLTVSVTQSSPGISGRSTAATVVLWDFELDEALTII